MMMKMTIMMPIVQFQFVLFKENFVIFIPIKGYYTKLFERLVEYNAAYAA